jgi:FkbM family methyltransferase
MQPLGATVRVAGNGGNQDFHRGGSLFRCSAMKQSPNFRFCMASADALQRIRGRLEYFFSLHGFKKHPLLTLWRALAWRMHCFLDIPARVRVSRWNVTITLPPEWSGAGATLFYVVREYYEPELTFLDRFLRPGDVFVDAGANCGVYTMAAASIVGEKGLVLAFEPGREIYSALERSVSSNGHSQIRLFQTGLSNVSGTARLYSHPHGPSSFSLGNVDGGGSSCAIEVKKLDDVLDAAGVTKVDCIKMDVEGAEELILHGATKLFERCKPRVIFEINPGAQAALSLKRDGAWRFLETRGYRFYTIDEEGFIGELGEPPDGGNVIALPAGQAESAACPSGSH